ncbi:MAG: TIR domain-containing protein [Piscinibacter sp.]|uniref:TIR domain-containing protein n=1 Tax=Piscinibacter TaxID=1114981 RepID=UPI0013E36465|nr:MULTISPECIES: TIR domain-containing protein [Piscinibacter]MCW5666440.1 TIR domain-containing protein [Piscinibacter sp.]
MDDARQRLRVFISYARADATVFAEELMTGLDVAGFDPFLDRHDIAAGEAWEERLADLILAADTVVFIITPAAVKSPRCAWEVQKAEELSKRILPIVAIDVTEADTPAALRRRNYVLFSGGRSFAAGLRDLSQALRLDVDWIREHTRLAELAARWEGRGRSEALLLRGAELDAAKTWLATWAAPAPAPTELHRAFIGESEAAEQTRTNAERKRLEEVASAQAERGRALGRARRALVAVGLLMALLLLVTAWGGLKVIDLNREVRREQDNVKAERSRVADARRDVAEFNQGVEKLRAQLDSVLLQLEGTVGTDPRVAAQARDLGRQITSGLRANIRLSRHFTLADLTLSETAGMRGIENAPDPDSFERLRSSAQHLDRIKELLKGCPIRIVSGYRGPALNRALRGAMTTHHATGYAFDITCEEFGTPYRIARTIEQSEVMADIDQLYLELGRWVHVSFDPQRRRQLMTTFRADGGGQGRMPQIVEVSIDGRLAGSAPGAAPK